MLPNCHKGFRVFGRSFINVKDLLDFVVTFSKEGSIFLDEWFNSEKFIKIKTSGSTGKPKNILLSKQKMMYSARVTGAFFDLPENTKALLCLSADYIAGKMMWVRAMVLGWDLDIVKPTTAPLEGIFKNYDFMAMVPLQVEKSLEDLHRVKKIIVGGGRLSQKLQISLQKIDTKIYATYGMTETITHIAVSPLHRCKKDKKIVYKTLPNIDISEDKRGCLIIFAPKITKKKIITNDCVRLIDENHFQWLGRYDNVINSGGVKLHPEIIEKKIEKLVNKSFFLTGLEDEVLGQCMVLVIEGLGENITGKAQIKQYLKAGLKNNYVYPKAIYFVENFLRTPTGKIRRKATLQMFLKES